MLITGSPCVSSLGSSFIIDGRFVKSINQLYNKRVAALKTGKDKDYWDTELARLTEKRNRLLRDAENTPARFIVNHCLANGLGTVVFGWNESNLDGADMGKKNNQEFVQIPTARLKQRIKELCEEYGIQFVETEESYTSSASFLDGDYLPTFGEKLASALGIHRVLGAGSEFRHRKHAPRSEAATQRAERWEPSGSRGTRQKGVRQNLGRG